jgi:predicted Fe-Mo cluster-binding NifX family protein
MKLAITPWNGRIAPVFESSERVLVLNVGPDGHSGGEEFDFSNKAPTEKIRFLAEEGVEQLICGAISKDLEVFLRDQGIDVYSFIAGDVDVVLNAWLHGQLDRSIYAMPGCPAGRHHRWGRHEERPGYGRGLQGGYYAKR